MKQNQADITMLCGRKITESKWNIVFPGRETDIMEMSCHKIHTSQERHFILHHAINCRCFVDPYVLQLVMYIYFMLVYVGTASATLAQHKTSIRLIPLVTTSLSWRAEAGAQRHVINTIEKMTGGTS